MENMVLIRLRQKVWKSLARLQFSRQWPSLAFINFYSTKLQKRDTPPLQLIVPVHFNSSHFTFKNVSYSEEADIGHHLQVTFTLHIILKFTSFLNLTKNRKKEPLKEGWKGPLTALPYL